ncbi:hypothetical protein BDV18DRAFT_158291 [Aspergillus unguis]
MSMSMTQVRTQTINATTTTDSYKEAVPNRQTQPGLEAVFLDGRGPEYWLHGTGNQPGLIAAENAYAQGGAGGGAGTAGAAAGGVSKKKLVWLFVALGVLGAAVAGLSIGLGVGLSKRNADSASKQSQSDLDSDLPNNATSTCPSTSTSTSTVTITSLSTPSSTSSSSPDTPCPSGNNTIISSSVGTIKYRINCDSDFSGNAKKTLGSVVLGSFDECVSLCNSMNWFQDREDVGATFNVAGTGGQSKGTCWCLGGEGKIVSENVGNDAAVPISS